MAKSYKGNRPGSGKREPHSGKRDFISKMERTPEVADTRSALSSYLKILREKNNLTQAEIAEKLHIQRQAYSHYETGRNKPSVEQIYMISKIYNEDIEKLLEVYVNRDDKTIDLIRMVNEEKDNHIATLEDFKKVYNSLYNDSIAYKEFLEYMQKKGISRNSGKNIDVEEIEFYYNNCSDLDKLVIKTILQRMYIASRKG